MYPQTCCSSRTTGQSILAWAGRAAKRLGVVVEVPALFFHQRWWREGRNPSRRAEARCVDEGYQDGHISTGPIRPEFMSFSCWMQEEYRSYLSLHLYVWADTKRLSVHSSYTFYQFIHTMGIFLLSVIWSGFDGSYLVRIWSSYSYWFSKKKKMLAWIIK